MCVSLYKELCNVVNMEMTNYFLISVIYNIWSTIEMMPWLSHYSNW